MKKEMTIAAAMLLLGAAMPLVAEAGASDTKAENAIKAAKTSLGAGYLKPEMIPDSNMIVPPPPAVESAAWARDREAAKAALALRGSPRWTQATADAELFSASATGAMTCAAGFAISEKQTPAIQKLLRRSMADLGTSPSAAKRKYMRPRPFMLNGQPTCTPDMESRLRQDGSYPSGHSAIGYGWGIILAEIIPDRAAQLVARGRAFGESRRICNVHWLSDVEEGRVTATATVARLHADAAFQKDMKAAKAEALKVKRKAAAPDCARENAALNP